MAEAPHEFGCSPGGGIEIGSVFQGKGGAEGSIISPELDQARSLVVVVREEVISILPESCAVHSQGIDLRVLEDGVY